MPPYIDPDSEIAKLLTEALEKPPEEREAFILSVSIGNEELRNELIETVSSYNEASGFFKEMAQNLGLPQATPVKAESKLEDHSALVGRSVAQYTIVEHIGGGGMGQVYRAEDQKLKRFAALKFLPPSVANDPNTKERFLREAQAASALDHPNICTVFEIGEDQGRPFIAMAYYEGDTLENLIKRGPMEIEQAVDISLQLCSGLNTAHSKGIMHRDIKPANVIVTGEGTAKILDFGLAKTEEAGAVTQEGMVLGTAAYMSPEQARGQKVDHRSDIWSLGAMMYEMLTGERAFPGSYPQAILYGILNVDPEPVAGLRAGLPMQLVDVVDRALKKDVDARYATIEELASDLRSVRDRQSAISETRTILEDSPPAPVSNVDDDVMHILCVDDEPELELLMQQRFRKKIRSGDYKFVFAINGEEALEKLKRHPEVGLILTDLNMPKMDGLTLLSELGELDTPLRTVVVSAYGDMEKIRTAMNRGAFDFVTKPIDFQDLETTIEKANSDLEAYRRAIRTQQQAVSVQQEFDVARRIQEAIIPVSFPVDDRFEMYGFSAPAADMSGTFYDAFEMGDGRVGLMIGDAGGRGVTSALLMAMGQTFVKTYMQQGITLPECMNQLNNMLFAEGLPHVGLRIWAGIWDLASGVLTYANAGHANPYILRKGGSLESLEAGDSSIWEEKNIAFSDEKLQLNPGDALVLVSNGLSAITNESGIAFTTEKVASTIRQAPESKPTSLIRHVIRSVQDHAGDSDPREDLTILAVRRS